MGEVSQLFAVKAWDAMGETLLLWPDCSLLRRWSRSIVKLLFLLLLLLLLLRLELLLLVLWVIALILLLLRLAQLTSN
jgi:hypothetical protein